MKTKKRYKIKEYLKKILGLPCWDEANTESLYAAEKKEMKAEQLSVFSPPWERRQRLADGSS
jgi:hypothetical protein